MAHINLLPWREEERKRKKNEFFAIMGGTAMMMAVVGLATHVYMASEISYHESRNSYMEAEISKVDAKIKEISELEKKKEQLIARMRVIESLQSNRPEVVHMFDELVRLVPEGLFIQELLQKGSALTIKGQTQSNARVSAFMRSLEESPWFTTPALDVIISKQSVEQGLRDYTLNVRQAGTAPVGGK